ncbi:MAG: FtsX-like permease family protein [Bryobacteraceae bacterium]
MLLPVLRGREFQFTDDARGPGVAIVSERAARLYWPHEEAVGKRIRFGAGEWLTIAGVVRNAAQRDWAAAPSPEVYLAALQNEGFLRSPRSPYLTLVARASGDPAASVSAVRNAVWAIDRNLPVSEALTMQDVVETATARPRFEVFLLTLFAAVALLIATAGLHALIVFSVSRRVHEIGIRISLGATGTDVVLTVMRQGLVLALIGSLAGAGGALLLTRLMEGMLFGVHPADPWTYAAVAGVLTISALVAAYIPARRAASIDPIAALRQE